jgi:hypothetical protein
MTERKAKATATAGPSTSLRFAQDDGFLGRGEKGKGRSRFPLGNDRQEKQLQMQKQEQKQRQKQILRLARDADLWLAG